MTIWTDLELAIEAEAVALGYTGTLNEIGIDQPYAAKLITLLEIRSKLAEITSGSGATTQVLGIFRAIANGTGYSIDDLILLRQTLPDDPEWVNITTNTIIAAPDPADLGNVSSASNVSIVAPLPSGTNEIGEVVANAGTNLNTSLLAVETGGNLAGINAKLPSNLTVTDGRLVVDGSGVTQPVSFTSLPTGTNSIGQVTANAGTNLNTSLLTLDTTTALTNTRIGDLAETAPASDVASSGLNGRLQRIAQRITSLIALLPSALGSTSSAGSLSMTVAQAQFTETQLTAPSSTTSRSMAGYNQAFIQVDVASINTNVVIRVEGSNNGTTWSNLSALNTDTTITANGTYSFTFNGCPANIRTTFVSESGGTAATVDVITRLSA